MRDSPVKLADLALPSLGALGSVALSDAHDWSGGWSLWSLWLPNHAINSDRQGSAHCGPTGAACCLAFKASQGVAQCCHGSQVGFHPVIAQHAGVLT
jgi:hypothetical protein